MNFNSILFETSEQPMENEISEAPLFFGDLNLDQIVDAITSGKQEYNLKPFFYTALHDRDGIHYRHEIMQDLENGILFGYINYSFAQKMHEMRRYLAQADRLRYQKQKDRWFLDAVEIYCDAVVGLVNDLSSANVKSRGLLSFHEHATQYVESENFRSLVAETKKLITDLSTIKYCLQIKDNCIKVGKYEYESDYSAEVQDTFQRFKQGTAKDYAAKYSDGVDMNHVEAAVLDLVAKLFPYIFSNLEEFSINNGNYLDESIAAFDREIQFYVAWLDFIAKFKKKGLKFCYPQLSNTSKDIYDYEGFDLALANKLIKEKSEIICNDFFLQGEERIFVISGPNQGGKTTFARTFGQLHYLASLGCPVPGREAHLFLFDQIFTHFEKEETIQSLNGKLQDELIRINHILNQATSNSIIIMNEIFTSTTLQDATCLSQCIMAKIIELGSLGVWVTFLDELATFSRETVSMVSTVVPDNPALRTYKVVRKPADGLAYAMSIAEKYRLTFACIRERVKL